MPTWNAVQSDPLEIVSVREDGLGGVVRIPLSAEMDVVQRELITRGNGKGTSEIFTDQFFRSIVDNFPKYNRPVPAYFGHISQAERKKTPAAAFVLAVSYESGRLWGVVDLGPEAWQKIVVERGFRAWSIEAGENESLPEGILRGWTMTGGAITNTPGAPVQFAAELAAEKTDDAGSPQRLARWTVYLEIPQGKEEEMPEKQKTENDSVVADLKAANEKLEADLKAEREKTAKLEGQVKQAATGNEDVALLKASMEELKKTNGDLSRAMLARDVTEVITAALEAGKILPAQVEGWDKDPVLWLEKSPFRDAAGLRDFFAKAPVVATLNKTTSSGKPQEPAADPKEKLRAEAKKIAAERKCSFMEALNAAKSLNPQLYAEGMADYSVQG